jgi:hypothetical protein
MSSKGMDRRPGGWWENKVPLEYAPELSTDPLDTHETSTRRAEALELARTIHEIMRLCIPSAETNGGLRRFRAGYLRFLALAWVTAPEMFEGQTVRDLAALLGVPPSSIGDHAAHWRKVLAGEHSEAPQAHANPSTTCATFTTGSSNDLRNSGARVLPAKKPSPGSARRTGSIVRTDPQSY